MKTQFLLLHFAGPHLLLRVRRGASRRLKADRQERWLSQSLSSSAAKPFLNCSWHISWSLQSIRTDQATCSGAAEDTTRACWAARASWRPKSWWVGWAKNPIGSSKDLHSCSWWTEGCWTAIAKRFRARQRKGQESCASWCGQIFQRSRSAWCNGQHSCSSRANRRDWKK